MKVSKERRERLFKRGKPTLRPAQQDDIRWYWAAWRRQGYEGTPEEFMQLVWPALSQVDSVLVGEDVNAEFEQGSGPVSLFVINQDEWSVWPHVQWFPWATTRNKLRLSVAFLQTMRYARDVGCVKMFVRADLRDWFKRLRRYVPVYGPLRIPFGRPDGDEYVFYLRGRRNVAFRRNRIEKSVNQQAGDGAPATAVSAEYLDGA